MMREGICAGTRREDANEWMQCKTEETDGLKKEAQKTATAKMPESVRRSKKEIELAPTLDRTADLIMALPNTSDALYH